MSHETLVAALQGKPLTSEEQEVLALFEKTGTSGGGQEQSFAESMLAKKTKTVGEYDCQWIPPTSNICIKLNFNYCDEKIVSGL